MAVVDVEFIATANFSSLLAQTKMANASLAQLQKTTAAINAEKIAGAFSTFTSSLTNSGRFTSQMVNVRSSTEAFGKSLMAGKLTFAEYKRELSAFVMQREGMIDRLAAQNVRMAESTVIARGINPSTGQAMAQVVTSTGALSSAAATQASFAAQRIQVLNKVLLQASTSMINWGKNTQWAGRQMMVGLTMPLLVIGGLAAKTYYDFSKELTRFVKVYGNGVSELSAAAVKGMEQQVTGLAMEFQKTLGVAMKQTAELAGLMAQAGYEGEKLTSGMRDVTRLSILGAVDMTTAWKAYQSVQNVFHRTSAQMTDDINFFSGVESTTSLSLQDITASIPKAAPVIRSLGGDIKDLTGYMVAMREGGVPAAEAANTLKTSLARLIAPTRQTKEVFKGFGIDIQKIVNDHKGHLTDMLLATQKALDKLDPTDRAKAIQQAFGKQRFANVTALFNNLYREGSQSAKALEFASYSAGERAILAAREIYKVQNTDAYKLKRSWGEILVDLAKFGQKFLAVTTKVVQGISKVFQFFDKFPKAFKEFAMGALIFVAFVGPIVMLTGVIGNFIGSITKGLVHLRMLASGSKNTWAPLTPEMVAAEKMSEKFNAALIAQTDNVQILNTAMTQLVKTLAEIAGGSTAAAAGLSTVAATAAGTRAGAAVATGAYGNVAALKPYQKPVEVGHTTRAPVVSSIVAPLGSAVPGSKASYYQMPGGASAFRETYASNQGPDKQKSMSFFRGGSGFQQIKMSEAALQTAQNNVLAGITQTGIKLEGYAARLSTVSDANLVKIAAVLEQQGGRSAVAMQEIATILEIDITEANAIFEGYDKAVVVESKQTLARFKQINNMQLNEVRAEMTALMNTQAEMLGLTEAETVASVASSWEAIDAAVAKGELNLKTHLAVVEQNVLYATQTERLPITAGQRGLGQQRIALGGSISGNVIRTDAEQAAYQKALSDAAAALEKMAATSNVVAELNQRIAAGETGLEDELYAAKQEEIAAVEAYTGVTLEAADINATQLAPVTELNAARTELADVEARIAAGELGLSEELMAAKEQEIEARRLAAEAEGRLTAATTEANAVILQRIMNNEALNAEEKVEELALAGIIDSDTALRVSTGELSAKRALAAAQTSATPVVPGGGMGRGMGIGMGVGMGMMAGSMFTHGNTQKVLMGGSMVAMMAPMMAPLIAALAPFMAIVAPVALFAAVTIAAVVFYKKWKKSWRESESWMISSKESADQLGYKFADLTVSTAVLADKTDKAKEKVTKLVEALKQAPKDNPLNIIAEDWKNDASGIDTVTKAVSFFNLQLARGVDPSTIRTQIASLLELSGKQNLAVEINLQVDKINTDDMVAVITKAVNDMSKEVKGVDWWSSIWTTDELDTQKLQEFTDSFGQLINRNKDLSPEEWQQFVAGINQSDFSKTINESDTAMQQFRGTWLSTLGVTNDRDWHFVSEQFRNVGDAATAAALKIAGISSAVVAASDVRGWDKMLASVNVFNDALDAGKAKANAAIAKLVPHTAGSAGAAGGEDPYKAQKDANDAKIEHENKIIKAIEKRKTAEQKAFDAKKKQDDYEKKRFDDQIGYREALASGDFGAAARIANNMANDAAQNRKELEHQRRQDAYQGQIDTHQGTIDKLTEANKGLDTLSSKAKQAQSDITDTYNASLTTAQDQLNNVLEKSKTHNYANAQEMQADNEDTVTQLRNLNIDVAAFFAAAYVDYKSALTAQTNALQADHANLSAAEIKMLKTSQQVAGLADWLSLPENRQATPAQIDAEIKFLGGLSNQTPIPESGSTGQQLAQYYVPGHPSDWSAYRKGHGLPPNTYPSDLSDADRGTWINSGKITDNGYEYWYFQKKHAGGKITGSSDEVPILAQRGEYMINAKAAKKLGVDRLDIINTGELPKYHTGGQIDFHGRSGSDPSIHMYAASTPAAPKSTTGSTPPTAPKAPKKKKTGGGKEKEKDQDDDLSGSGKKHGGIHSVNNAIAFLDGKIRSGSSAWTQLCEKLARTAYGLEHGMYGSAKLHFEAIPASQRKAISPAGAKRGMLGFWNTGRYGHIAIADGSGKFYSNLSNGKVGKLKASTINSWNGGHHILGVTNPWWSNGNWIDVVSGNVGGYDSHGNPTLGHPGGPTATFHTGGPVKKLQSDEVEAVLQTGEYVVQRSAVNKIGEDKLNAINSGILPADTGNPYAGLGSPPSDGKEDMPKYGLGAPMSAQSSRIGNVTSAIGFLQKQVRSGSTAWQNLCDRLASTAYNMAGKFRSAKTHFNAVPKSHIHGTNTASAKRGELGFWNAGPYGHVATADGHGNFYTNTSRGKVAKLSSTRLDGWGKPLGVTDPWWSNNNWISVRNTMPRNMALHEGGPVNKLQSDDVHRVLQAGEYVVQKNAVKRVGLGTLDAINSGQQLATTSNSSYNITVNGVPGMDVNEIASKVVQKIEMKEKRKGLARN